MANKMETIIPGGLHVPAYDSQPLGPLSETNHKPSRVEAERWDVYLKLRITGAGQLQRPTRQALKQHPITAYLIPLIMTTPTKV